MTKQIENQIDDLRTYKKIALEQHHCISGEMQLAFILLEQLDKSRRTIARLAYLFEIDEEILRKAAESEVFQIMAGGQIPISELK